MIKKLKFSELFEKETGEFRIVVLCENVFAAMGRIAKFITPKTIKYVHKENVVLVEDGPYADVKDGKLIIKE